MNKREQTGMEVDDSNTAEVKSIDYSTGTVRECSDMAAKCRHYWRYITAII